MFIPLKFYRHLGLNARKKRTFGMDFYLLFQCFSVSVVPFALSVFRCLVMPSLLSFEAFASPFQVEIFASVGNALSDLFDFVYL